MTLVLDQSLLLENFFTTDPTVTTEAELQSGQLNIGKNAHTVIAVPPGTAHHIAFGCDNGVQGQPPARLRVAIFDRQVARDQRRGRGRHQGPDDLAFPDPSKTGVISVNRSDAGTTDMGYVVY